MKNKLISKKKIRRFLRYVIMFLVIFIASQYVPNSCIDYNSAFILSTIAAITFTILDLHFPQIY